MKTIQLSERELSMIFSMLTPPYAVRETHTDEFNELRNKVFYALRDAKNDEPVSDAYKLPFEQWLLQQNGKIDVDCGCVASEAFFHWLRVAYEAGSSPVISDGWVACSERLPEETKEPDGGATGYLVLYAKGKEPNGGFSVGVWNVTYLRQWWRGFITHWMPLPAAPQGVNYES